MAINIHTDPELEKYLEWLSKHSQKTKTDVIKELVSERYHLRTASFRFGAFKISKRPSIKALRKLLKSLDKDNDLD